MRSLHEDLSQMQDARRAQGRKHDLASVFAVYILAFIAGYRGSVASAQFASSLSQDELAAVGSWRNPKTGLCEPVSKSTLHRVLQNTEPSELEHRERKPLCPLLPVAAAMRLSKRSIEKTAPEIVPLHLATLENSL